MAVDVALFGAAGYTGLELAKLLGAHSGVRLVCAASDSHAGRLIGELTGRQSGKRTFVATDEARATATTCAIALLAVPPDAAKVLVPELAKTTRVIDLSHAHRGTAGAVYGLTSLFGSEVTKAHLVANPGCYATAVITAVAPLVQAGLVDGDVVVCAGSGVTGAGRSTDEAMSLGEMYGEVRAYKVLRHQHVPEIEAALGRLTPRPARVTLTTHLLPIARGIFATVTAKLSRQIATAELVQLMCDAYADDPTVTIMPTAEDVSLRKVVGTNQVLLGVASHDDRVVVTASLDNLLKGAAGQAIENMNLMLGLPRMSGLDSLARHA